MLILLLILVIEVGLAAYLLWLWLRVKSEQAQLSRLVDGVSANIEELQSKLTMWQFDLPKLVAKYLDNKLTDLPEISPLVEKKLVATTEQLARNHQLSLVKHQQQLYANLSQQLSVTNREFRQELTNQLKTLVSSFTTQLDTSHQDYTNQLADQVTTLTTRIARDVLHQSLSEQQHHELVMNQIKRLWEQGKLPTNLQDNHDAKPTSSANSTARPTSDHA